jgi:hypothetical protein
LWSLMKGGEAIHKDRGRETKIEWKNDKGEEIWK